MVSAGKKAKRLSSVNQITKQLMIMRIVSLMFRTQKKFLDLLDSQSIRANPSSYQHNAFTYLQFISDSV